MADLSIAEVLTRAADLLEKPGAWTQGAFARDIHGHPIRCESEDAASFCAIGALYSLRVGSWMADSCERRLSKFKRVEMFAEWNDAPGRTQAEVVAALRAAAEKARQS
jgi:hypothetical protein